MFLPHLIKSEPCLFEWCPNCPPHPPSRLPCLPQFAGRQKDSNASSLTPAMISDGMVGFKDERQNLFDVWRGLLRARPKNMSRPGRGKGSKPSSGGKVSRTSTANRLNSLGSAHGHDTNKLLSGLHYNFLRNRYNDPGMTKTCDVRAPGRVRA